MNTTPMLRRRIAALDWPGIETMLDDQGWTLTPPLLTPADCNRLAALYTDDRRFRARIDMARYRFGNGGYGYFSTPLPPLVKTLREALYARLAPLANQWAARLPGAATYPAHLEEYLALCAQAGQRRPTPLLLRYETGGFNCLHQDRYGDLAFPLQATGFLSQPKEAYAGGEFLLVEQRPRQQARATVLLPEQGQFLIFPSLHRPVAGKRGWYRASIRHGVSTVTQGTRYTLGIIFHDAK